jgi:hypothetical protein
MSSQNSPRSEGYWDDAPWAYRWDHLVYRIRVRTSAVYLWGSAGITQNMAALPSLLLHIRNDEVGEPVILGTSTANGPQNPIGTLQPGEIYSVPLQNINGVYALCFPNQLITTKPEGQESMLTCFIKTT